MLKSSSPLWGALCQASLKNSLLYKRLLTLVLHIVAKRRCFIFAKANTSAVYAHPGYAVPSLKWLLWSTADAVWSNPSDYEARLTAYEAKAFFRLRPCGLRRDKQASCFFCLIGKKMATPQRFELRLNEPKSFVLPLHHRVASFLNVIPFLKNSNFVMNFFQGFYDIVLCWSWHFAW